MTSLASQLHNLQTTQTDLYDEQRKIVSVLVSADDARKISRDAYYKIGCEGFKELCYQVPSFEEFSELFNDQSRTVQRAVLHADRNEILNEKINKFLIHLGPHLERAAALKSLEWLVQRFQAHEMNIDSFISCILPHFETQLFVRLLQVVNIKRSKTWEWLKPTQKVGRPLPRRNLFNQWSSSEWFRNFVANTFMKQMETIPADSLQYYAVFFILTVEGGLHSLNTIAETHLTTVYRIMDNCLYSESLAARGGMAFLLLSLSTMANLAQSFVSKILEDLCNNFQLKGPMGKQMVASAVSIVHTQNMTSLPDSVTVLLLNNKIFSNEIIIISKQKNVSKFISAFVSSAVSFLFNGNIEEDDIPEKFKAIINLLETVTLPSVDEKHIMNLFVTSAKKMKQFSKLKECPGYEDILLQLNQYECLPHAAASELLTDAKEEKYLVNNNNFDIETDNVEDEKREKARLRELEKEEIEKSISLISSNLLLKSTDFHLVREEEYGDNFHDIVRILQMVIQKKEIKPKSSYGEIIKELFNNNLKSFYKKMYFLSMIWSSSSISVNNLDSNLKEWALITATAMIKRSTQESIKWIMSRRETFVPSLILPMCEAQISSLTFDLMKNLVDVMGPKNGHKESQSFLPLIKALFSYQIEIVDDAKFLPQAIRNICKDISGNSTLLKTIIVDEAVPMRVKSSLLYAISELDGFKTLQSLVPLANEILDRLKICNAELSHDLSACLYYILIRIPECKVKKLNNSDVSPLLMRCIRQQEQLINFNGKMFSPQALVISESFIVRISHNEEYFLEFLQCMTDQVGNFSISSKFRQFLSKTSVSSYVILKLIGNIDSFHNVCSVKEARAKRKRVDGNDYLDLRPWKKLKFIIELVGIFAHVNESWSLIKPLFGYLELSMRELSLSSKNGYQEIFHQRILTTIHQLLELTEKDLSSKEIHEKVKIHFSLLVQLLRTTENPDTRRRVLIILSLAMAYFPDEILQNVISIFTFMGATLIQMDDNYSIQVIHEALDTILPPLIKSVQSNTEDLNVKLFQIIKVFVVAFPDIPENRKLPLYLQLAQKIGADHLWLFLAATAETHVFQQPKCQSRKASPFHFSKLTDFWNMLFKHFGIIDRLHMVRRVVQFLVDIPEDKDSLVRQKMAVHMSILNNTAFTTHNLHRLKFTCVQILTSFVTSSELAKAIYNIGDVEAEVEFSEVYHVILDVSIPYLKEIASKESSSDPFEAQYWPKLAQILNTLVKVLFELLPPQLLIKVILNLVWSEDLTVRYNALEIVAEKMDPQCDFFREEHAEDASKFIKFLTDSARKNGTPDEARQMSMFTLQSLLKSFGENIDVELVQSVLQSSVKILKKNKVNSCIKLQTVLTTVEGVALIGESAVESVNDIMNFILTNLQVSLSKPLMKIDSSLHILTSSLQKVAEVLPHHLSDNLSAIINVLCGLFYHFQDSNSSDFIACIEATELQVLSIDTNIVLDNMKEAYFSLLSEHTEYLQVYFRQLSIIITNQDLESLLSNLWSLQRLFSLALQIRISTESLDNINEIENAYFKSVSDFMMRCNQEQSQANFKHLKRKCEKYDKTPVTVTFYKFCRYLSSSLQVLFISFQLADDIFEDAVAILANNNTETSEEMFTNDNCLLVDAVLDLLHNIFVYDSIEYMNRGRIATCMKPIIKQIDNVMGGCDVYKNRISNHLKPCIAKLTTACKEDDFWTDVTRDVLSRIKTEWNGDNLIILGTLEVFEAIVEEAGHEYVQSQLSDIMVFITEALEIIDPEIQSKTKQIFSKLEETTGESLKSYLGS